MFDPHVPKKLLELQCWLGKAIGYPLQRSQALPEEFRKRAEKEILPSRTLNALERVEIYHQQYWWRLLKILHENYPFLTRLFGYLEFNRVIAIPFLENNPPSHVLLYRLGDILPHWILKNYEGNDLELVHQAALIDQAFLSCFWKKKTVPFDFKCDALSTPLFLQEYVHVFELQADLIELREKLLDKEVDHWNTHPFPSFSHESRFVLLYRDQTHATMVKKISKGEYKMLSLFREGQSLEKACEIMENEEEKALEEAQVLLPLWIQTWKRLELLTPCSNEVDAGCKNAPFC